MRSVIKISFLIALTSTLLLSCGTTSVVKGRAQEDFSGQLNESTYNALIKYLVTSTKSKLNDTIFIKYDYNKETCWDRMDEREDQSIIANIQNRQTGITKMLESRPKISIFQFREPGEKLNKVKKWDNTIFIDSSKQLYNLLFKERNICGNSIMILPDKKFIYVPSDSHFTSLYYTHEQIKKVLSREKKMTL